ncbi:tripartite tricarboxylate transporter TctB family protein [Tropicimonas sp. IMCC6043]|uniref:tripartite tricarboxylate transporter TctB family protein n=1 Tax=Tropicimonas sp. IMCC6043 TaxID=2510645 RepID=UPI00101D7505|nr:tripartite tricarboxylate transporter TctB family protein [Tropicimonas sp. IMCC6043]RYH08283.1 hypothetical protein EU800_16725 [Tropicimonas sp. IMCC6043]
MSERNSAIRVDLLSGLFTVLLGTAGLVESLRMPRFAERGVDPNTVPGVTPGLISAALLVFGLLLTLRAIRGAKGGLGVTIHRWNRASILRTVLTIALALTYGMLLFGSFPFIPVTAGFVFVFVVALELVNPDRKLSLPVLIVGAALLALVAAAGIHIVFKEIFLVRLPG